MPVNLKSILAATDLTTEGNHAVERAAMLAGQKGIAGIHVLHVVEQPRLGGVSRASSQVGTAQRVLGRVALEIGRENGVSLDQRIKMGSPLQVIAEESKGSDLLVLGTSTDHALRDLVLGSTAERLLTKTPASILAVRSRPKADYGRVLVALDFSTFDDNALAYARALAPAARLDLMHVFDTAFEGKMRYAGVGSDAITEYRSRTSEAAWREMNSVADRVPGRLRTVVVNGHIASNVLREGRKANADLIVVGHPRRSWLSNLVMRRIAAQVLSDAHSDILVVH